MRSPPATGRPAAPSGRTVAAPRRRKKATARSTRPKTSVPMATPGCERDAADYVKRLGPVPRPRPHVAELLAARDALLGHQPLEHELARRHHRRRILLAGQPHLFDQP